MEIYLKSIKEYTENKNNQWTLSEVLVDDVFKFWACEDLVREIPGQNVRRWKVAGKTAIPAGVYNVELTHSPRFNRILPLLESVDGFSGIRIHAGNTAKDTDGCILIGLSKNEHGVYESRRAMEQLLLADMTAAERRGEKISMTIDRSEIFKKRYKK